MANITITIPDAVLPRVVEAMSERFGYTPGTETRGAFVRRKLIAEWTRIVIEYESAQAGLAASAAKATETAGEIVLS